MPRILFLLLTFCVVFSALQAEEKTTDVFGRVTKPEEVTDDGVYLIGCTLDDERFVLLTNMVKSGTNKLVGSWMQEKPEKELTYTNVTRMWRITRTESGTVRITSAENGKHLTRVQNGGLGITLETASDSRSEWTLSANEDQTFTLTDATSANRELTAKEIVSNGTKGIYFDNYSFDSAPKLVFFRQGLSDRVGDKTTLEDGATVGLNSGTLFRTAEGTALDLADNQLTNDAWAPDNRAEVFTFGKRNNECFVLEKAGKYLDYQLQTSSEETLWMLKNGKMTTVEETPRCLCYDAGAGQWKMMATTENATATRPAVFAAQPEKVKDSRGVLVLRGGWSATALADLDFEDSRAADLTQISLPVRSRKFSSAPTAKNYVIFVAEASETAVPEDWHFVVVEAADGLRHLLRAAELTDKQPFFAERVFSVEEEQLSLERNISGDGHWQTFCLPFPARVPDGVTVTHLKESENDNEFALYAVSEMTAGMPYLVKANAPGDASPLSVRFTSLKGTTVSAPASDALDGFAFQSTFDGSTVADETTYLLSNKENAFVRAAAGSRIPPFRCALENLRGLKGLKGQRGQKGQKDFSGQKVIRLKE
ncbi:MAG: hypothetical protein ACI3YC_01100 [Alloprevotella sp.]